MIDIKHLCELLNDRLESLLPELVGGKKKGREWIAASTSEGGYGDSLNVGLLGHKRGKWVHRAAGNIGGDILGLIAYTRTNQDMGKAIAWAREFLGGKIPDDSDAAKLQREQRIRQAAAKEKRERQAALGESKWIFWKKSTPDILGTPVDLYLQGRDISLRRLGHVPGCLHFAPKLYNSQLDTELPAMVAAIVNAAGEQIALHRTYLIPRDGGWDRLREDDGIGKDGKRLMGKKVLGSSTGGTIRLWAGESVHTETGEVRRGQSWPKLAPGASIMLAEGIETGLSLALAMPARRIVCTVAIEGFANVELPPCFSKVTIAADRDDDNPHTAAALERAKKAHAEAGRALTIVYPPEGIDDWNTALRNAKGRAA